MGAAEIEAGMGAAEIEAGLGSAEGRGPHRIGGERTVEAGTDPWRAGTGIRPA